jgi:antitoxin VapB
LKYLNSILVGDMTSSSETAKVFMSGRSQAVRLPKSFRFNVDEVSIRRVGDSVILTPLVTDWAVKVRSVFDGFSDTEPFSRLPEWSQDERESLLP